MRVECRRTGGKPGKKKYATRKREAVCMAGEGAGGTNNAEPCRAEGAEAPCLLMASFILRKDSCETYTPNGTCGISWGMRYAFLNIRYFLSMRHVGRSLPL